MYIWIGSSAARQVEDFRRAVDVLVEAFRLDPELPEIVTLKALAPRPRSTMANLGLQDLNPYKNVRRDKNTLVIGGGSDYGLRPLTLARYHIYKLDSVVTDIFVDSQGAHLLREDHEMANIEEAAINPRLPETSGKRYRTACTIIRELTGLRLDWEEHHERTALIHVAKSKDDSWKLVALAQPLSS